MKVKRFKSFRFKMVMYMFFSLIATFITEGLIFMGIYLYETEIIAGEYKKVWGASGQGKMSFGTFTMSQSIALDAWVIAIFTILLLIIYFILISNKFVTYVREIISGVERMKSGDLMEEIPVRGEDEFSEIAASINEMRHNLYETMEAQKAVEKTKDELITNVAHDLRTPLCGIKTGRPFFTSPRLNPYPQTVQVLGADTHKIPIFSVLNAGRFPFAAREHLHALATMQAAVVVGKVKANVVAVGGFIKNQSSLFHKASSFGFTGFRPRCMSNSPSRQTSAFSA